MTNVFDPLLWDLAPCAHRDDTRPWPKRICAGCPFADLCREIVGPIDRPSARARGQERTAA
jgi:hypothetical protein